MDARPPARRRLPIDQSADHARLCRRQAEPLRQAVDAKDGPFAGSAADGDDHRRARAMTMRAEGPHART